MLLEFYIPQTELFEAKQSIFSGTEEEEEEEDECDFTSRSGEKENLVNNIYY